MYSINYGPLVRVEHRGSPFDLAYDLMVCVRDKPDTPWQDHSGFNSLSNDYAHTSAKELAMNLEKKYANRHN